MFDSGAELSTKIFFGFGYKVNIFQLCPDGAPIKKKMVYASSASAIKSSLGTAKILQFQVVFSYLKDGVVVCCADTAL